MVTPDLVPGVPTIHHLPTSEKSWDCSQLDNPGHEERGEMVGGCRQRREQSGVMRILTLVNTFHQAPAAPPALAVAARTNMQNPSLYTVKCGAKCGS